MYLPQKKHKYRQLINVNTTLPSASVFISILSMNKTLIQDFTYNNSATSKDSAQLYRDPALCRALRLLAYYLHEFFLRKQVEI